ncbi:hypothetical protein ABZU75_32055 [Streptosporangium sp. NPDC005286]|uniref:hypothetical protein n=1 Tax=Streptosporangium sp. NPDC005286 TaxID=3154463 RepID=UPI0033B0567A
MPDELAGFVPHRSRAKEDGCACIDLWVGGADAQAVLPPLEYAFGGPTTAG